ncbi:WG repeat-containing protein [Treponema succinifaciens]|uniref:KWG Leptospira repeat protein n=1 Tax=Treponema succinifaciens (strain ATCC 33096 / DSM 2489 / 6091) TaxID=869209 RepID=F2NX81_TRES6|nr:WG repeat-containing protein [Treponema succinifaciens]AEB13694.1 hypothetical protein Tresu_0761 [Treponema succinifaciens DSM 2489]
MKVMKILFIILAVLLNLCSCNNKNYLNASDINNLNVTRFSMTDEKTGKRYSGIFNENKEVLFCGEGIIYPFKGGFSYIHKNASSNIAINIHGKKFTTFELSEVHDSFYGYGLYSTYDSKNDISYLIDKNGNKIKEKNILDISENIEIIKKNKKLTYYDISKNSYLENYQLYDICFNFYNGVAKIGMQKPNEPIYKITYLYGLIDRNGNSLLPCEFAYMDYTYPKYVIVSKTCEDPIWERKAEVGMVDYNNNWIIEPKYSYVLPVTDNIVALWIIQENSEYWLLYNITTKEYKKINSNFTLIDNINLFTKNNTEDILLFYDFNTEKYGFINSNGDIILKSICQKIESNPDNGYYQVLIDNKWMLFNKKEGLINPKDFLNFTKL